MVNDNQYAFDPRSESLESMNRGQFPDIHALNRELRFERDPGDRLNWRKQLECVRPLRPVQTPQRPCLRGRDGHGHAPSTDGAYSCDDCSDKS